MQKYEIEIKSLLGSKENADKLKENLVKHGYDIGSAKKSSQLNHYFSYSGQEVLNNFKTNFSKIISSEKLEEFNKILEIGKDFSIRTRESNGTKVILVVKASLDAGTSANGVSRAEFEEVLPMTLEELDQKLLESGLEHQAKWSRDREEFVGTSITVCLDKNAGYGYLAEFETVTEDKKEVENVKKELEKFMQDVDCAELQQDRLARMFDFYNKNWAEYYGTDKIFNIE